MISNYPLEAMRDGVAKGAGGQLPALPHEHVEYGVQHVVEQHQHIRQLRERAEPRPQALAQRQVQR